MIQLVAILGVLGVGIVFSILGGLKLSLTEKLKIDDAKFGSLISTLMFSSIIIVLLVGPLVDMLGHKPIAIAGFLIAGLSIFLLAKADSYKSATIACIGLGMGGMCINTVGNTLLPMVLFDGQNAPAASNLGNAFFGIGAFITPFFAGFLLKKLGYSNTLSIIGGIVLIPIIFAFIATDYPAVSGYELSSVFALLATPVVLVASIALFCYIALEVSMGGWVTSFLTEIGFDAESASKVLSAFWISIMAIRLITANFITSDMGPNVILFLSLMSVVSIYFMTVTKSKNVGAACIILTGVAFAPIFPTVLGYTFSKISPDNFGSAFAIMFAIGLFGGTTVPKAIGNFAEGKTIQKSMIILVATAGVLAAVSFMFRMV